MNFYNLRRFVEITHMLLDSQTTCGCVEESKMRGYVKHRPQPHGPFVRIRNYYSAQYTSHMYNVCFWAQGGVSLVHICHAVLKICKIPTMSILIKIKRLISFWFLHFIDVCDTLTTMFWFLPWFFLLKKKNKRNFFYFFASKMEAEKSKTEKVIWQR